jgi:hypothetical protein
MFLFIKKGAYNYNLDKKIVFNFFNENSILDAFQDYFGFSKRSVGLYLDKRKWDDFTYIDFIKEFNIPTDRLDTSYVFITAQHITALIDGGRKSLRKYGLLNLKDSLEKETALKRFLANHDIAFDISQKKLVVNGVELELFQCDDICTMCENDRNTCRTLPQKCREAINLLYIRLYCHRSEIEVFIGRNHEKYSSVNRYPEIISRIDELLLSLQLPTLGYDWENLKQNQYYVLEFDVNINQFEWINKKPDSYYDLEECLNFLGYNEGHYLNDAIPKSVYSNYFLIKNSIIAFFNKEFAEEFGAILPDTTIPYKDLRIKRVA